MPSHTALGNAFGRLPHAALPWLWSAKGTRTAEPREASDIWLFAAIHCVPASAIICFMRLRSDAALNLVTTACGLVGAVWGTVELCRGIGVPVLLGWLVAVLTAVRLLATRGRRSGVADNNRNRPGSVISHVAVASLSILCLVTMATMAAAWVANPAAVEVADVVIAVVLLCVGALGLTIAMRTTAH